MGSKGVPIFVVSLLFFVSAIAQVRPDDLDRLPVKRVVLYKSGVGYFEHLGAVQNNQDVAISFTSGQLNDVLKSLTVLDLNGGRIAGVGYGSAASTDRQLGDLRLPVGEKASLTELLGALRGARLEVRSGNNVISGRLLSVERKTRIAGGTTLEVDYLSLIGENGDVRTTELSPSFSVRLLDRGLAGKVDRYLDLVGSIREADVRRMVISTEGSGDRSLFVSYISEVPVWKATYRIVLNQKDKPLLQGWAIVDNTVGQDWEKVQLSLVAGAPQSFVQNLSQPYYAHRPVVSLQAALVGTPQTYESTLIPGTGRLNGTIADATGGVLPGARLKAFDANNSLAGEATTNLSGVYDFGSLADGTYRVEVEAAGFRRTVANVDLYGAATVKRDFQLNVGGLTETVEVTESAGTLNTMNSSVTSRFANGRSVGSGALLGGGAGRKNAPLAAPPPTQVGMARALAESAAQAQELGDLFEYKLKEPISIQKNRSALVPIIQSPIGAEKVSVWNERAGLARPQRALWINNSSGLTLDGGTFSVLEDETFAGEGIFDPIRPGEKRLVSYATDLALNVNAKSASEQQRVTRARVNRGVMILESETREKKTYTFRNEDNAPRMVIVEHPSRSGFELRSDVRPIETTAGWIRFRLPVAAKETASLMVEEARPIQTTYALGEITDDQVGALVRQRSINKDLEGALRRIIVQKKVVQDLEKEKSDADDAMDKIFDDQQRLRENMKALKGSADERTLLQRYTRQLNEQEDKLESLRKAVAQLDAQVDKAQATLDQAIQELVFDAKI
jgi:hypothetical protein